MNASTAEQEDTGIWTNSKALVHAFKALFEELWRNSSDIQKKLFEIKTGQPTPETYVIRGAEGAYKKYVETIDSAKKEIVSITSSNGIIKFWKNAPPMKKPTKKNLIIKIMTTITNENLELAQQLPKYVEVRDIPTDYLGITVVDGKHLFIFKTPSSTREKLDALSYFEDTFYTNDLEFVESAKDTLMSIWKSASPLSAST